MVDAITDLFDFSISSDPLMSWDEVCNLIEGKMDENLFCGLTYG